MKKSELKQLIKEEINKVLNEEKTNRYKISVDSKSKTAKEDIDKILMALSKKTYDRSAIEKIIRTEPMPPTPMKATVIERPHPSQAILTPELSAELQTQYRKHQKELQEMSAKEAKSNDYYKKGMMYEEDMNNFTLKFVKDFETPLSARDGWGKIIMRDVLNIAKAAGDKGLSINNLFKYDKFKDVTVMKPAILNWINQLVQDGYLTKA
jgi:hypothetical protein